MMSCKVCYGFEITRVPIKEEVRFQCESCGHTWTLDLDKLAAVVKGPEPKSQEEILDIIKKWLTPGTIELHCGEVTPEQLRLVRAVLNSLIREIET